MAILAWTAALQEQVAETLLGTPYASLKANQKSIIDGTSTPPTLVAGAAYHALQIVNNWASWLTMAGVAATPDTFEPWLVDETCLRACRVLMPDRYSMFERSCQRTKADALRTLTGASFDPTAAPSADAFSGTLQNVRKYVANYLVRLDPPLFIPIDAIDQAFHSATNKIWKSRNWLFKRRKIVLSVSASSVVTSDLAGGETIDGIASKVFYYTDDSSSQTQLCWAGVDDFLQLSTRWGTSTGRPQVFRIQKAGDTRTWRFAPLPDAAYTLNGEVYADGPGTPSSATDATIMAKFPAAFWPMIRMATLAEVLESAGHRHANELIAKVEFDINKQLTEWDDPGAPDNDQSVRDATQDVSELTGSGYLGGGL